MSMRFFKKWPLCIWVALMVITMLCAEAVLPETTERKSVDMVIAIVLAVLCLPGFGALILAPARLLIALWRKTLSYESHADAVLVLLMECLFFLLLNLSM